MNLRDANIADIEEQFAQWQDAEFEKYMRQFDFEPDAKIFDEKSDIPKILEEMISQIFFQRLDYKALLDDIFLSLFSAMRLNEFFWRDCRQQRI